MEYSLLSSLAAKAYGAAPQPGKTEATATSEKTPAVFSELMQAAAQQVAQSGNTLETAMGQVAQGNANLIDVVTAVAAAEANLETVISVRDQFIKAYQEVMRMPI